MKILYAIQGTGNGHLSRARDIIPLLQKRCETDILVSGYQTDVELPFEIKYKFHGLSFIFGKKGGVDMWNTYVEANIKKLRNEIKNCPVEEYDFVINDFEPVSAWACYLKKVPCVSLSHQAAVLDKNAPKPGSNDPLGKFILRNYAPASVSYGIHFCNYSKNIFTPVIRQEIRLAERADNGHYSVYLPAYDDKKIIDMLAPLGDIRWQIFSKRAKEATININFEVYPVTNDGFIQSLTTSTGVLCGAGFETPAEALFLGKKLLVVPMQNQYEQQCNAAALKAMGVPVIPKLKKKYRNILQEWVDTDFRIDINYPDNTERMIQTVFEQHVSGLLAKNKWKTTFDLQFPLETTAKK